MEEKDQRFQEMERQVEEMQARINQLEYRKKRKPWKVVLIILGSVAVLFAVLFGVLFAMIAGDKESPAMAEQVIQAMIDQDTDRAYALTFPGVISQESFAQGFESMCQVWTSQGGGETFQMRRTRWAMESSGGVTQYTTEYIVTSGRGQFQFTLVRMVQGDEAGMVSAQIGLG